MALTEYAFGTETGIEYYNGDEIINCYYKNKITHVFTNKGNILLSLKSINEIEKIIDDTNFVKINSSHIININHIHTCFKNNSKTITMINGKTILVNSKKKQKLLLMIKSVSKI